MRTRPSTRARSTSTSGSSTSCWSSTSRRARAIVEPFRGDYYTQAKKETTTAIEEELRGERELGVELSFGQVSVTEQVIGYQKKAIRDHTTLDLVPLVMPESTFETEAVWFVPDARLLEGIERMPTLLASSTPPSTR